MQNEFMDKALSAVAATTSIPKEDMYIVWFCKTLQNWKALISTDIAKGIYWEATHNGDKNNTYVDQYRKFSNDVIVH